MMSFISLSAVSRSLFGIWMMILIVAFMVNTAMSLRQKREEFLQLSLGGLLFTYFMFHVAAEISSAKRGEVLNELAGDLGRMPCFIWILLLLGVSVFWAFCYQKAIWYKKTHITPMSIKEAADSMPVGVCFYDKQGSIALVNPLMNKLFYDMTHQSLVNGRELQRAVAESPMFQTEDGTMYRFTRREIKVDGQVMQEMAAEDITEILLATQRLNEENERLRQRSNRMKEYGLTIDDVVRREEVLKTKSNIHDEMNRLLLSTDRAVQGDVAAEREKILETWQKNILLLCIEADRGGRNNALSDLEELSKLLGITLVYRPMPETEDLDALRLFSLAAQEAMTNAGKHGNAAHLYIDIRETDRFLEATFTNDGTPPPAFGGEGGGLTALRRHIEEAGGKMQVTADPEFSLTIRVPKGGYRNVL